MKINLYRMSFVETSAWSRKAGDLNCHIEINFFISLSHGFFFSVAVANKVFSSRNPFKALLLALESETLGMSKYDKLKERVRDLGLWQKL